MRTKKAEGVQRFEIIAQDPRPSLYLCYDGLLGLSSRPLLRDILEELQRRGNDTIRSFLGSLRTRRSALVHVYFNDFVSYGGAGDAVAEFFFGTYLLLHDPPPPDGSGREALILVHPASGSERIELEPAN